MIESLGASMLAGQAVKKAIFKELLGECLTNENGEYYTKFNKVSKRTFVSTFVGGLIIFPLCFIVSFFIEDPSEARFFLSAGIFGILMMVLLSLVMKKLMSNTWTLKENGLEVKTGSEAKLYPYSLIKESKKEWPTIQYRNDIIVMAGKEMIRIPYVNNTGGVDFIIKLGKIADIQVLETKYMVDIVLGTEKHNRQQEDKDFINRSK